jgi:hypothetical protein
MKKNTELGSVDAFGLDEMGQPVGLNPVWGAVVGTGLGTLGAIGARQFSPKLAKHSELVGLGLSAAASGAMLFFEGTRAAGWTGLASAFLNNGLRQVEMMMFAPQAAEAVAEQATAMAQEMVAANNQVSGAVVEEAYALGAPVVEDTYALGQGQLPELVGANLAAANEHVQLMGGPALAQHAGHWGATVVPSF